MQLWAKWPCEGPLLSLAEDLGRRLLPAFDTATGMPFGTVNLRHGVPDGETSVTCTACVGTFIIEFGRGGDRLQRYIFFHRFEAHSF
jgi:hypothetical protein